VDSVIAAWLVVFNPESSNAVRLAAGISRVRKDDSIIATGNAPTGDVRPPLHISILLPPQKA
jgi:hypothetical protein